MVVHQGPSIVIPPLNVLTPIVGSCHAHSMQMGFMQQPQQQTYLPGLKAEYTKSVAATETLKDLVHPAFPALGPTTTPSSTLKPRTAALAPDAPAAAQGKGLPLIMPNKQQPAEIPPGVIPRPLNEPPQKTLDTFGALFAGVRVDAVDVF